MRSRGEARALELPMVPGDGTVSGTYGGQTDAGDGQKELDAIVGRRETTARQKRAEAIYLIQQRKE